MNRRKQKSREKAVGLAQALVLVSMLAFEGTSARAQMGGDDPNAPGGGYDVAPPSAVTATGAPSFVLQEVVAELDSVAVDTSSEKVAKEVRRAAGLSRRAHSNFVAMDSALKRTVASIRAALKFMAKAKVLSDEAMVDARLDAAGIALVEAARGIVEGIVDVADVGGVDRPKVDAGVTTLAAGDTARDGGDFAGAVGLYGKGLKLKNAVAFDVEAFRTSVETQLAGQVVGYAAALVRKGLLVNEGTWATGLWRTPADVPSMSASTTSEINIASVSKPITAAAFLHLTQTIQGGAIDIDDPIGPWLPWDWTRGVGVDSITFRELFTHRSGLANNLTRGATGFTSLQTFVATDITLPFDEDGKHPYTYQNANFAMLRIMLPYMAGAQSSLGQHCNDPDICPIGTSLSTAESFRFTMQCEVLNRIGLSQDYVPFGDDLYGCAGPDFLQNPDEGNKALLYWLGTPAANGVDPGDWTQTGGAGGWYMSAVELAQFLAYLRYDDDFLTKENRALMFENYLGFNDPDDLEGNFSWGSGKFGSYRMHGGDLCYPQLAVPNGVSVCSSSVQPAGVGTCIADFPDGTQAVLAINSRGGSNQYQCSVLKEAYEKAWLKK